MSDLFGAPPAPAPAPPPARRARAPRAKAAPAEPQHSGPAAGLQVMQAEQVTLPSTPTCTESQAPAEPQQEPRLYGLVTLHDGRQVDSGSAEWKLECLASTLLQLGAAEREAWILGYGTPEAQVELRLRIGAVKSARENGPPAADKDGTTTRRTT